MIRQNFGESKRINSEFIKLMISFVHHSNQNDVFSTTCNFLLIESLILIIVIIVDAANVRNDGLRLPTICASLCEVLSILLQIFIVS